MRDNTVVGIESARYIILEFNVNRVRVEGIDNSIVNITR